MVENGSTKPHTKDEHASSGALYDDEHGASYDSVEHVLDTHIPPRLLQQVKRILYGQNQGAAVRQIDTVPHTPHDAPLDVKGFAFHAKREQFREPRLVTIGLVQHSIKAQTTAPFATQRRAILDRVAEITAEAAGHGVQILCLQECFFHAFWVLHAGESVGRVCRRG
jgi:beta-ureidopropionase